MKKTVTILVTTAILLGSTTTALATTASGTSTDAVIAQLQIQIADLMTKIATLKQAQGNVQVAQQNVSGTMQLIGNLKEGMSGEQVKLLQTILATDKAIYPEGTVSGYYGRLTKEAVKRFQKHHGIEGTGYTGPKTMNKVNELLSNTPLLKNQDKGDEKGKGTGQGGEMKRGSEFCIAVPPGHLIAPGWLKHHEGANEEEGKNNDDTIIPRCKTIPPGIWDKIKNSSTTPPVTPTPDITAPILSAVTSTVTSSTTVTVAWTTNELAGSKVYYGTTTPVNTSTALTLSDATLVTAHALYLSGLTASTTYYAMTESRDAANNVGTSSPTSFTTAP